MRTYSLITKPYRIRLKNGMSHSLRNTLTDKFIRYNSGAEFWCCKAYSEDHGNQVSLLLFNHSFITSFTESSTVLPKKWDVIDCNLNWRDEISVLQASDMRLNCFTHGEIPGFVLDENRKDL